MLRHGQHAAAAWGRAIRTFGTDLVDSFAWAEFETPIEDLPKPEHRIADFLEQTEAPDRCSIVCNPPYSYIPGIAERFARHALTLATKHVCILVPSKWLSPGKDKKAWSQRSRLFRKDHPPRWVLHMSERPSMPPGDRIPAMGSRAFRGGMGDYCWIIWDVTQPTPVGGTRTVWLPPLAQNSEIVPLLEMGNA